MTGETFACPRCGHKIPCAYKRSHNRWHTATDAEESPS